MEAWKDWPAGHYLTHSHWTVEQYEGHSKSGVHHSMHAPRSEAWRRGTDYRIRNVEDLRL